MSAPGRVTLGLYPNVIRSQPILRRDQSSGHRDRTRKSVRRASATFAPIYSVDHELPECVALRFRKPREQLSARCVCACKPSEPENAIINIMTCLVLAVIIALFESLVGLPKGPLASAKMGNPSRFILSFPMPL